MNALVCATTWSGWLRTDTDFTKNNLDCLRLILAGVVVLFHVDVLTNVPAFAVFGRYCSPHFAVHGFFVISGLLIYRSYQRSSSTASYFSKRVRRIYPAYFTVIVTCAIALSVLSAMPLTQYFSGGFWKYLVANLLFLNFAKPSLPGVFAHNLSTAVDGALWTLKIEVAFYATVPFIHFLCSRFGTKRTIIAIFGFSSLWRYGFDWLANLHRAAVPLGVEAPRTFYDKLSVQFPAELSYFIVGILLLLYFDKLKENIPMVAIATGIFYVADHWFGKGCLDVFWISGEVFIFGFWRYFGDFSKCGDFSYGLYIVHWPILQVLIWFGLAKSSPAAFLMASFVLVGLGSILLWHLVEKRFLASSSHYRRASAEKPLRQEVPV